ncbi:MAG: hypothetical protein BAJALOKI1v1_850015 [Promethearchaeota archaeon]|nr:MAG: hypothetical protein BAJALOKI1v1_850015 [Candidatus Lokiarchaeota archaeon]
MCSHIKNDSGFGMGPGTIPRYYDRKRTYSLVFPADFNRSTITNVKGFNVQRCSEELHFMWLTTKPLNMFKYLNI